MKSAHPPLGVNVCFYPQPHQMIRAKNPDSCQKSEQAAEISKANLNVYSCCPAWSLPPGCGPGGEHGRRRTLPLFAPLQHREQEAGSMVSVTDARLRATIQPSMCGQCGMSIPVLGECGYALGSGGSAAESAERIGTSAAVTRSRARHYLVYLMSCPAGAALAGGRGLVCLSAPPVDTAKNAASTYRPKFLPLKKRILLR